MKYSLIKCVNGSYSVHAEGITDLSAAKTTFHGLCQTLWNAPDVITGEVAIMDENLDFVEMYKEFIRHEPQPQPEPEVTEEPTEE